MTTAIQFQFSGLEFVFKKYHQTCFKGQFFFFVFVETKVVRDCRLSSRAFWPASVVIAQILLLNCYELTWLGQIRQSNLDLEWKEEHKNKCPNVMIKRTPSNFFGIESLCTYFQWLWLLPPWLFLFWKEEKDCILNFEKMKFSFEQANSQPAKLHSILKWT